MHSRSMVLEGPNRLTLREFLLPGVREDDALLRVEAAGVCHTDVGLFHGSVTYALPIILGHEIVGRIERIGPVAARRWGVAVGDRVIVEATGRCGFCRACIEGNYRFCKDGPKYGTYSRSDQPPYLWGAYGEYLYLAPGSLVYRAPEGMSADMAVLLTVAISNGIQWTVLRGGVKLGDVVVVQGVGAIGLCCVAAAQAAGAALVIATGLTRDAERLALAEQFGAHVVVDAQQEDLVERVRALTGGQMADVVVDTTGSGQAVRTSLQLVRPMGTVVSAGVTGDTTETPIHLDRLLYNETRLQGVFTFDTHATRRAITLAQRGTYPFERLVTHHYPLERAEEAVRAAGREIDGIDPIKVVITPGVE